MIIFRNVSFTYPVGVKALEGINLEIGEGERVGVIGQNGSGKTTLMKLCNGLLKPTKGDVIVYEKNTKEHSIAQLARDVGYVFQNPDDQIFSSTIFKEVSFGPKNLGLKNKEKLVKESLESVGLWKVRNTHPYNFGYNTRKLIAIASVLAMNTKVIILDEPTTGQDPQGKKIVSGLIKKFRDRSFIVVSHDIDFIGENCDRVIVLNERKMVMDGPAHKVLSSPRLKKYNLRSPMITRVCKGVRGLPNDFVKVNELVSYIKSR